MTLPVYKTVTRTQGANRALKEGAVRPATCALDFVDVDPLIAAFRRMVRGHEFDICEMAITTYLCARAHGKPMTAIPVPLVRQFHHGAILVNTKAGIATPKDLEGRRVGVNRGYTVTTGVWARGILAAQYGVDLSTITWVLSGDEHVAEYIPPSNVVAIDPGRTIEDMLVAGELAAAIGVDVKHPDVAPLTPDARAVGLEAFRRSGHYPINHLVVVKDALLADHPDLGADLFEAFAKAKQLYVEALKAGRIDKPDAMDELHRQVMAAGAADPMPYGVAPNRANLEALIGHAFDQGIIPKRVSVESLFDSGTLELVG